jgi:hypothetical protein
VKRVEEEAQVFLGIFLEATLPIVSLVLILLQDTHPHRVKPLVLLHRIVHVLRHKRLAASISPVAIRFGSRGAGRWGLSGGRRKLAKEDDPSMESALFVI